MLACADIFIYSLVGLSHNIFLKSCSKREKPLKMGYMVDICRSVLIIIIIIIIINSLYFIIIIFNGVGLVA